MNRHDYHLIPEETQDAIRCWVLRGEYPGGFLTAVLENRLLQAIARADMENLSALPSIVNFLYNRTPASCWGDPGSVAAWPEKLQAYLRSEKAIILTFGPFGQDKKKPVRYHDVPVRYLIGNGEVVAVVE